MPLVDEAELFANSAVAEYEGFSGETDSYDEEVELLRCQADLVEAAAEIGGTTSADDDLLTTDPDFEDEEDGLGGLGGPWRPWQRSSVASVVIEEDEEGISSGFDDDGLGFEVGVGSSEIRSQLWAQSLLRLKRSIDEIYSLCEFESDEALCTQVRAILDTASGDFDSLTKQLDAQQEYSLMAGEYPFKSAVAWTTRTPRASRAGESVLEQLERAQGSPTGSSVCSGRPARAHGGRADPLKRRSRSLDPKGALDTAGGGTGEALGDDRRGLELDGGDEGLASSRRSDYAATREDQLEDLVQRALRRVHSRLGQAPSRPSPEELQKRSEDRHRRAQQLRASQDNEKMLQGRMTESRILAARERRQQREQSRQRELLEKMTRARRQYQDQLRMICQRARKQNMKTAEVAFIAKEALKSEKEILKQKQVNAHISRVMMREQMRKRLIESAERVARVSENRRKQLESWQIKVQQELEEKERLASQRRREHIHAIRVKTQGQENRSEIVRGKRRELQEEDERTSQDFLRFKSKHIGRLAMNCDGLPDAVREEVVEQLHGSPSVPLMGAGRRGMPGGGSGTRRKAPPAPRPCTPPPTGYGCSPKSSPPSALRNTVIEAWEAVEMQHEEGVLDPFPDMLLGGTAAEQLADADGAAASSSPREAAAAGAGGLQGTSADARKRRPVADEQGGSGPAGSAVASEGSEDEQQTSEGDVQPTIPPMSAIEPRPEDMQEDAEAAALMLRALRARLADAALAEEEALRMASEADSNQAATASTAHRARLSKLAADLKKVVGTSTGTSSSSAAGAVPVEDQTASGQFFNLERADIVLADFCKVLGQSQRDADFALVLKLGCAGIVVEICLRVKDSMGIFSGAGERAASPVWRQMSSLMLSALKWLSLVCKHEFARAYMLLTNRVVLLADVAVACLDAHFGATTALPDSHSVSVLFLPQVLHVLSLHVKQTLPSCHDSLLRTLVSYLLLCGLSDKLRELFRRAEVRGMRLFDGASPVPLLLLRAMGFLGNLVSACSPAPDQVCEATGATTGEGLMGLTPLLATLRRTELFGIVSVLVSILLCEGRREKPQSASAGRLPQTVISLAFQAVRILNNVARLDLATLQETLGACRRQELYHLLVCLIDYCTARLQAGRLPGQEKGQEENELLHETIVLLGYYCLQREENQGIMCYGEGQTLLSKITSLPLHYFMDERGKAVLFPTILATCFRSEQNLELLHNEMNLSLLRTFLANSMQKEKEAKCPEAVSGFGGRFPAALWPEAICFFEGTD